MAQEHLRISSRAEDKSLRMASAWTAFSELGDALAAQPDLAQPPHWTRWWNGSADYRAVDLNDLTACPSRESAERQILSPGVTASVKWRAIAVRLPGFPTLDGVYTSFSWRTGRTPNSSWRAILRGWRLSLACHNDNEPRVLKATTPSKSGKRHL
jgi:hypothetical protein